MSQYDNIKSQEAEAGLFFHRLIWMILLVIIAMVILVARLYQLQVVNHDGYTAKSEKNSIRPEAEPPMRGLIFDRHHRLIADNKPSYSLEIIPERIRCERPKKRSECIKELLIQLRSIVNIEEGDHTYFNRELTRIAYRGFESVPLKRIMSHEEIASVASIYHRLPGVNIVSRLARHYPYTNSLAHVVGYVAHRDKKVNDAMNPEEEKNYEGTTHLGKKGLELQYEKLLHGKVGKQRIERNVHGRAIQSVSHTPSTPGHNIYLTLDLELQALAEKLLAEKSGSIVAIDPNNGEVLVLVSKPSFDPNEFVAGIPPAKYHALNQDPKRPLYTRALIGTYVPGSTIKPFYALGGLHYRVVNPEDAISCIGYFTLPGVARRWRDWKKEGHGRVNLNFGILRSCDVYFYNLALKLNIDRITELLGWFGLGSKTGIDQPQEGTGILPSRQWKQNRFRRHKNKDAQKWYPGDTVSVGIGQGYINLTPLQLAQATTILASRGKVWQPRLLFAHEEVAAEKAGKKSYTQPILTKELNHIKPEHWERAINGMIDVVHAPGGTAGRISATTKNEYKIAGKTGTAQVFELGQNDKYDAKNLPEHLHDHALFIAFAPADKPKIALAVIVENGGSGSGTAAPLAGELIRAYMDLLKARETVAPQNARINP